MPALAGLLIVVGFGTLKIDDINLVWKTGKIQQVVMVITFIFTLLIPLQYAVLIGVSLAILLFVFNQSNKIAVKEWVYREGQLPIEQDAPEVLAPNEITVLIPYGSLFFAAAAIFEEELPVVDDNTRNSAVILHLRGRTDLGSTFLNVLERYSQDLQANESRLMLVGLSNFSLGVIEQTGLIRVFGRENVFEAKEVVGASIIEAHHEAEKWVAENIEPEEPAVEGETDKKNL
jgi:SulP family sulfate permease